MVDTTSVPPSNWYLMVFLGHGTIMLPMKPANYPNVPRRASLKIPPRPDFVTKETAHPARAPIAIPQSA
jgi:hypothetical protein